MFAIYLSDSPWLLRKKDSATEVGVSKKYIIMDSLGICRNSHFMHKFVIMTRVCRSTNLITT